MQDLGGCHVAEPEAAGDIGQRAALDGRLPERLAFAQRELLEYAVDEVPIGHRGLHVRPSPTVGTECDQGLPQSLATPKQVEAEVARDCQQPRPRRRGFGRRVQGLDRDQEDFLAGVGGIVRIAEDARTDPQDGGTMGLVELVDHPIVARIPHPSP